MQKDKNLKKTILFVLGAVILVAGISFILKWWSYVGIVFKGTAGIVLSLVGIFLLSVVKE